MALPPRGRACPLLYSSNHRGLRTEVLGLRVSFFFSSSSRISAMQRRGESVTLGWLAFSVSISLLSFFSPPFPYFLKLTRIRILAGRILCAGAYVVILYG
ncbi:hypothetical protein F4802DRAFT_95268 [Xylaria palmicola]|nr:hypothetical protein F4802DRAFT_95268 [Xylaria palmicola]